MRIASIHLPSFSLQAAIAAAPAIAAPGRVALATQPVAIVDASSPVVTACSRAAWARGVRPGMVASVARSHAPELIVSYDDVAAVLLDHLAPGGRFSRARVGVALPERQRGEKVYEQSGKAVKIG